MRNYKYLVCFSIFAVCMQTGLSQTYKAGDKLEAFINNAWKEVKIVKAVAGKNNMYEVQVNYRGAKKNNFQVNKNNLRMIKQAGVTNTPLLAKQESTLHLGKYDLYSGIPAMYLGHLLLLREGKYKVAFSTDENNYETGTYLFHAESNTIEWLSGMFRNNRWGGKFNKSGNAFRIEFNKVTYAESY